MHRLVFTFLSLFILVCVTPPSIMAQISFATFDVPGAASTQAYGINNSGQIVGTFSDSSGYHGFLKDGSVFTTIDVPGAAETQAFGINDFSQIVGYYRDSTGFHGFLRSGNVFTTIDVPGAAETQALGINNFGQIVGESTDSYGYHGFLKDGSVFTTIDVPGAELDLFRGINDFGLIVGWFNDSVGFHGFLKSGSVFTTIDVPGALLTWAHEINNSGRIVGLFIDTSGSAGGFVKGGNTFTLIGVPDAFPYGINDFGQIVGCVSGHGFIAALLGAIPPPTNLRTTDTTFTRVQLAWDYGSGNPDGFQLERDDGNGGFTFVATVAGDQRSYEDKLLAAGTTYNYRICAIKSSEFSGYAQATADTMPLLPVNTLHQDDPQWKDEPYPLRPGSSSIGRVGCSLTSGAMIVNYYATAQRLSFSTDPPTMLEWLMKNRPDTFAVTGLVFFGDIAKYAQDNGVSMSYIGWGNDDDTLINDLLQGNPAVLSLPLETNRQHSVVTHGRDTIEDEETFTLKDPYSPWNTQYLSQWPWPDSGRAPNGYISYRRFSAEWADPRSITIVGMSPIELLVTNSEGRQTGFDSDSGNVLTDIPRSWYGDESIDPPEDTEGQGENFKLLEILQPQEPSYSLQVIGTDFGTYQLLVVAHDAQGNERSFLTSGLIAPGKTLTYQVNYPSTPGEPSIIERRLVRVSDIVSEVEVAQRLGMIDNSGIASSLLRKLAAADQALASENRIAASKILNAFINEIETQSDIHIFGVALEVLLNDAELLLSQLN